MATPATAAVLLALTFSAYISSAENFTANSIIGHSQSYDGGLCVHLVEPSGYPCLEHTTQTKDGFLLGLQRVSSATVNLRVQKAPPVLLLHGLFMGGDAWFMDFPNQSLGFILADRGFDVWVGNVRGTKWSHGHISLSDGDKALGLLGIHQLNLKSDILTNIIDKACDGFLDCSDMLASITGKNCCFNSSRVDFYLEYEPHPSSLKNLKHLFQMIRKGTFARYDYGSLKNLLQYGQSKPPSFDLSQIPESLPLWMAYGGNDALGDVLDVQHTLRELRSKPNVLYLDNYGHVDFLLSTSAYEDLYDYMIRFFRSCGKSSDL